VAKPETPELLLRLATSRTNAPDLEDFCGLSSVALAYLLNEAFQTQLVNSRYCELLQQAFFDSYTRFNIANADPEEAASLRQIWNAFVQVFADISALPSFVAAYPLGNRAVQRLVSWLGSPVSFAHLQTAACLSLGNLSRSDEASIALCPVVYKPLLNILINAIPGLSSSSPTYNRHNQSQPQPVAPSTQLLHAVLSFLKNLAIPAANKPLLGPTLLSAPQSILPKIWSALDTQPDTQFAAVSLTRLLVTNTPVNAARLCAPLSHDPSSPARERSTLQRLIDLAERADADPTKIEAGRAIAAVCRLLHSGPIDAILPEGTWDDPLITEGGGSDGLAPSSSSRVGSISSPGSGSSPSALGGLTPSSDDSGGVEPSADDGEDDNPVAEEYVDLATKRRARFYTTHRDISRTLRYILIQQKFPTVRGEILFVLALMSRSADGMHIVIPALQGPEAMRALMEGITGRDLIDGHELEDEAKQVDGSTSAMVTATMAGGGSSTLTPEMNEMVQGLGLEPQQTDATRTTGMKKVERENALVLVSEMLKGEDTGLPLFRRYALEEMMRKGWELVVQERAK
jgi:hypothetical protein